MTLSFEASSDASPVPRADSVPVPPAPAKAIGEAAPASAPARSAAVSRAETAKPKFAPSPVAAPANGPTAGGAAHGPRTCPESDFPDPQTVAAGTREAASTAFAAAPVALRAALSKRGFEVPTAVQRAVLAAEAAGRDLRISSQTGSGKTVALGIALAHQLEDERSGPGPDVLVIVPTRELATQVAEELAWLFAGLADARVEVVTGGTPRHEDRRRLRRDPRVLVGTPGRLLDHTESGVLDLSGVRALVLDEADQMLDMGFRDELEGILDRTPASRRTHLVSATFPEGIRRLAARYQRDPLVIEGTRLGDAHQDIEHLAHPVRAGDRYAALVNLLLLADGERTLVFVERRNETTELAARLEADGFDALPLSGDLAQNARERTLESFRSGRTSVLVATDVAARGLDVPDIALVVHTAPSLDAQVYTHRSGRTGRAGKRGRSVLLSAPNRRRAVARALSAAGVELAWGPVPGGDEVRSRLAAARAARLDAHVAAAVGRGPEPEHLHLAEVLLRDREPLRVVAALLEKLEPSPRPEPREVRASRADREVERDRRFPRERNLLRQDHERERGEARGRYAGRDRAGGRNRGATRQLDRRGGRNRGSANPSLAGQGFGREAFVRFFMNRGRNQGATPARVLAAVCRRGAVSGADVGSIAIHPNATTFDVRKEAAERFERSVRSPDSRDPHIVIRRPVPDSRRGRRAEK